MHKTILITGGAGYIGSHISWLLARNGYQVVIIDHLKHIEAPLMPWATLFKADFADSSTLEKIFSLFEIDAVIHCAAFTQVSDSLKEPKHYYDNNLFKTGKLLERMLAFGIKKIIFSSSCAAYGTPEESPLKEEHPCNPITPYGMSKFMAERIITDYAQAYGLQYICLRYFNAAGAEPEFNLGENHVPETHIIPLLLHAMHYQRPFILYGSDYDTPDGSCIRDFLHVSDIAHAHYLALKHLASEQPSDLFNLGTGKGVSIKQLIKSAEQLFKIPIKVVIHERRPGDPDRLVADPSRAEQILRWKTHKSDMQHILSSAYTYLLKSAQQQKILHPLSYLS